MKRYKGNEVQLRAFLTLEPDGGEERISMGNFRSYFLGLVIPPLTSAVHRGHFSPEKRSAGGTVWLRNRRGA
jgi:hypothetical protein